MTRSTPRRSTRFVISLALIVACLTPASTEAARPVIRVHADPVVELFGIVFRLAEAREFSTSAEGSAHRAAIDAHFGAFRDHAAVDLARRLRRERGISYDAVISLAHHIHNVRNFSLAAPLDPRPEHLDRRWDAASATAFINALRSFVNDTGYLAWWDGRDESHEALIAPLREGLYSDLDLPWFHRFTGLEIEGTLEVIVSPVAGASAYSSLVTMERGATTETNTAVVIGAFGDSFEGDARRIAVETIVHELCHPVINPVSDRLAPRFGEARWSLYPPIALAMEEQGYGEWKIVLREVFVRFYTRLWIEHHRGRAAAERFGQDQVLRGFDLVEILAAENPKLFAGRDPSVAQVIERSVPVILDRARFLAESIDPHRPRVISIAPDLVATGLAPGKHTLQITFDRAMEPGYSLMKLDTPFPEVSSEGRWNEDRTVFSIDLTLAAGTRYRLGVNGPGVGNFRGAKAVQDGRGVPLAPLPIVLSTETEQQRGAGIPQVVSITPAPDAKDVASGRAEIRIEFDRPMAASYSVTGGGPSFPKVVGDPRWNGEGTVFTLPVELQAGRKYEFGINGPGNTGFRGREGEAVEAVWVRFVTGGRSEN